jgi:hypothetical protein
VAVHPQELLLQQARTLQASPGFRDYRTRRQVVEHRIARLAQLGIRQARYFGRRKTLFQLLTAAAVANLTLLASRAGVEADADPRFAVLLPILTVLLGSEIAFRDRPTHPLRAHRPSVAGFRFPSALTAPNLAALRPAS